MGSEAVTVQTVYSSNSVVTKLIITNYKLGDKDVVVMVDRSDVSPAGAQTTLHVDQFG